MSRFIIHPYIFRPPAPALWTPLDLGSELHAWYDFSLLSGTDNTSIGGSAIPDQSGNGRNATPANGTNNALLQTSELNGKNVIQMRSGTGSEIALPNNFYNGKTEASCYFVVKANAEGAGDSTVLQNVGSNSGGDLYPWGGGFVYHGFCSTTRDLLGNPSGSLAAWRIMELYSKASDKGLFLDGVLEFSSGTNTVKTDLNTGNTISVGGASNNFAGLVAEIIYTSAKQSTTNREKVEGYLAHKWELTGNLPGAHPYKTTPPTV
jgi:hypothetical protein